MSTAAEWYCGLYTYVLHRGGIQKQGLYKRAYQRSSLVMGKLLVSFLVTGVVFLTACGGGDESGDEGSPSLTTPGDTNITAQTNMSGDGDGPSLTTPGDTNITAPTNMSGDGDGPSLTTPGDTNITAPTNMSGDGGGPSLTTPGDTNITAPTNMSGDGGGPSLTTPGDTNITAPTNMPGDGGGPSLLSNVELSISPVANGLRIQWHNLTAVEGAGGIFVHLNLTSDSISPVKRRIAIESLTDNSSVIDGLTNNTAYRLVEVAIELAGNISRVVGITWSEPWQTETNALDNNGGGIVVGANHDGDGRADTVDEDDDNDGKDDDMDDCRLGDIGWNSTDGSLDNDGDGCRDDGAEDSDDDNDGKADDMDSCRLGAIGWDSTNGSLDNDGDGCRNDEDIDADGDGLIEISTAAELDAMRYVLDGTGLRLNATASFNDTGCGGSKGIMSCNGYELVNNISLTDYIATTYPNHGWLPIGYDARSITNSYCQYASSEFSAIFEGNHFVVSGLSIDRAGQNCIGFFTYLGNEGEVHRLGLKVDEIRGNWVVGGLVAFSEGGLINSSYATIASLTGDNNFVGGLVANSFGDTAIYSSYTIIASLTGDNSVGGLVGSGLVSNLGDVAIHSSYAVIDSLNGERSIGGLIGRGDGHIENSYAVVRSLTGGVHVGGLVGKSGENEDSEDWMAIDSSYAIIGSLNGDRNVGGLVGVKNRGRITSSYAIFNTSLGDRYVGGLVGGTFRSDIISSYAIFNNITSKSSADDNGAGGLIGQAAGGRLISSYVIANSLEGDGFVGGFVGNSTAAFRADSSYGVFGSINRSTTLHAHLTTDTLIGSYSSSPTISNSYWNNDITNLKTGILGEPKSGSDLTGPTDYGGIYDAWDDGVDLDGGGVDNITIYCDSDLSGTIETAERTDDNRIWDFGSTDEYPAIGCTPDNPPAAQRAWWSLNDRGEPTLDNERLDEVLDSHFP